VRTWRQGAKSTSEIEAFNGLQWGGSLAIY
jgi:hypothetical protein